MIGIAGASRMSSVRGLNANPHTAIVLPASDFAPLPDLAGLPNTRSSFTSSRCFWILLTCSTASSTRNLYFLSAENLTIAWTSFGKQLPPYPTPENRNADPMRESVATACRTMSTSAPNSSHTFAISFMNEIRVASMAFAAYLHNSALAQSITMMGAPVRVNGRYSSTMMSAARGSVAPMTTRSGLRKSSTAAPCLRNSGFDTTENGCVVSRRIASRTSYDVPTGTVLLSTITL